MGVGESGSMGVAAFVDCVCVWWVGVGVIVWLWVCVRVIVCGCDCIGEWVLVW